MGEAKRRGTYEQRREQAQAKRVLIVANTAPAHRPVVARTRRSLNQMAVMLALAELAAIKPGGRG